MISPSFAKLYFVFSNVKNELNLLDILSTNCPEKRCGERIADILNGLINFMLCNLSFGYLKGNDNGKALLNLFDIVSSATTVYATLDNPHIKYREILFYLALDACDFMNKDRTWFLVVDDTLYERPSGKNCEGCGWVYDHVSKRFTRGYFIVAVFLTDGIISIPLAHRIVVTSDNEKLLNGLCDLDANKVLLSSAEGKKIRKDITKSKYEVALEMLSYILPKLEKQFGKTQVEYLLADSWYVSNKKFVKAVCDLGLECIGLVRIDNTKYVDEDGNTYTMKDLVKEFAEKDPDDHGIYGHKTLRKANGDDSGSDFFNIVFVKNHASNAKKRAVLPLLCTDLTKLPNFAKCQYGFRWCIERGFFNLKNRDDGLGLKNHEFRSLDSINAVVSLGLCALIVATVCRHILQKSSNKKISVGKVIRLLRSIFLDGALFAKIKGFVSNNGLQIQEMLCKKLPYLRSRLTLEERIEMCRLAAFISMEMAYVHIEAERLSSIGVDPSQLFDE